MEKVIQTGSLIKHIYIHFPFCLRKCNYCSFYSERYSALRIKKYIFYLLKEIDLYKNRFALKPETIYFGGGTPSLLSSEDFRTIFSSLVPKLRQHNLVPIRQLSDRNIEISLEANPININEIYIEKLIEIPINRISLGAQSFIDEELKLLGRLHDSDKINNSYKVLRNSGYKNISLDMIYGLPSQTGNDVKFSLERMIELDPEHISIYCLSLEKDVPLFSQKSLIPSDEKVSSFYEMIRGILIEAGYEQYEISNFAKKGFASKHNICYWSDKFYLGFGPSASGYINLVKFHPELYLPGWGSRRTLNNENKIFRYTNPADLEEYFKQVEASEVFENFRSLSKYDHEKEFIFLSLRRTKGMSLQEYQAKFKEVFLHKYRKIIDKYLKKNFIEIEDDFLKLTPKAYFVSNEIFSEFM